MAVPEDRLVVLLLTDVADEGLDVEPDTGFLWFETVLPAGLTADAGLVAGVALLRLTAVLAGADVTLVATALLPALPPPDATPPDAALLTVDDSARLTLLLVPTPPLLETLLVNTRSEPVYLLPPK